MFKRQNYFPLIKCFTTASIPDGAFARLQRGFDHAIRNTSDGSFPLLTPKQTEIYTNKYDWNYSTEREASVLVLLCCVEGSISILFTKRAAHLNLHASEISFPGGHYQPNEDDSLQHTALREAREELCARPDGLVATENITIFGQASRIPSLKGTPVTPILACLPNVNLMHPLSSTFPGDPSEVELVFAVSVLELLQSETSEALPENRFGMTLAPVFPSEHGKIWGLTALILRPLLHRWLRPILFPQK
ncbi:hypothetical protein MPSEU_000915300 [Mayamaea pseudoterrestris]|nr:hypothetical protein MPSEU_000915300 [Mayamaea pseudoterrestris]